MVLSFENRAIQGSYKQYFLQDIEIKDYNIMIDGRNFFDQPVKTDLRTYDIIRNILTGQGDYPYFKKNWKLIEIDLRGQQKLLADPKAIQQIVFTGNLDQAGNTKMFFIIKEAKEILFGKEQLKYYDFILF